MTYLDNFESETNLNSSLTSDSDWETEEEWFMAAEKEHNQWLRECDTERDWIAEDPAVAVFAKSALQRLKKRGAALDKALITVTDTIRKTTEPQTYTKLLFERYLLAADCVVIESRVRALSVALAASGSPLIVSNGNVFQEAAAVPIELVAEQEVQLRKRGRLMVGLCPLHREKRPSFTVYPETNSFYCFGCGVGGDVTELARRIFHLPDRLSAAKHIVAGVAHAN